MNKVYRSLKIHASVILFLMASITALAQERVVSGKVTDREGTGMPGVNILKKGTTVGTSTDVDGNFTITANDDDVLVFSFIGFASKEMRVGAQTSMSLVMEEDVSNLQEVVVIGYGSVQKSFLTTSVSTLDQREVKNLPVSGIDQAIQGRLAGVTVSTNGGQPGGGVSVRVRGITSVNGNQPLYVIDGVPVNAEVNTLDQSFLGGGNGQTSQSVLSTLNPADIESIEVLKDASAQAIYGSRAANGVVLVTTKRGKAGEGKITYDTYYGIQTLPKKLDVMDLRENAIYQGSVIPEINAVTGGNREVNGAFADPSLLGPGTDWQDEIYQQGAIQSHLVSFAGGTDRSNYYLSGGAFDQKGILIGTDFKRYTLRGNIEGSLKKWLKVGFSTNLTRSNQRIGLADAFDAATSVVLYNSPAAPVRDFNGDYVGQIRLNGENVGNSQNPVAMAEARDVRSITSRALGALYGEIEFIKGLTLRNEINYDFNLRADKAYQPFLKNEIMNVNIITPSRLREQRTNSIFYALKNYFNYNRSFGKHNLFATIGHEAQYSQYDYVQANRENLTLNLPSLAAGKGGNDSNEGIGAGAGQWAMESYFGRVNYNYADRYAVSATLRADGSSSFGPNNRWGYFPAASASWTITGENFANDLPGLSFLKLRAGYGSVGNQNTTANSYTSNISLVTTSPFGNASVPANVGNPNLSWESVVTYNAGIDATFLKNNFADITIDVYKKVTTDMLLPTQLGAFSGLGTSWDDIKTPIANNGQITNKGIDISLTTHNFDGDFVWNTTAIFSHYKNTLDFLNTPDAFIRGDFNEYGTINLVAVSRAGQPVGSFYGYVTDGLYRTEEELNSLQTGLDVEPTGLWLGDIKYRDLDDDGDVDDEDVTFIGNPNPKFTLGLTNSFSYRGFDLSVFLYGSFGAEIFNYTRRQTEALSSLYNNQLTTVLDRYTEANTGATLPRYNEWHNNNRRISDRYVEDGTYVRIQNVQLGYTLPKRLLSSIGVSSFKVYVSGQNLKTFTNYSGYDPELGSISDSIDRGILINVDNGRYPVPKSFTVGANIEF